MHFHTTPPPTDEEVADLLQTICRRILRLLARRGLDPEAEVAPPDGLAEASPALVGVSRAFGDAITLFSAAVDVNVSQNFIANPDRVGLSLFGGTATLKNNTITCAAFDLDGEPFAGLPASFNDAGGNLCGCNGPLGDCLAVSANLAPPGPVAPIE